MCENNLSPDFLTEHPIDPNNIWGDDTLKRKPFADDLTRRIEHSAKQQSFAVSLHGGWGTGKTYLLRRWQAQLQKKGRRVVYFNAWEDDFHADPLTAIVGQLWKAMSQEAMPWTVRLWKAVRCLDWKAIRRLDWKAIRCLDWKKIPLAFVESKTGLNIKDFQSTTQKTVGEYLSVRKKLDDFKKHLGNLAAAVWKDTDFPLVVIVDELDRCRPTFAIQVLERIKHFFGAPHIVFVFGVNKTGLQESIKSVYGNIDTEDYLRRFFDIDLVLPPASISAYCEHLLNQSDLVNALNHLGEAGKWKKAVSDFSQHVIDHTELSLRTLEHVVRLLRCAINARIASGNRPITEEAWSVFILAILKVKDPDLYAKFIGGKCRCADVVESFLLLLPEPLGDATEAATLVESAVYCLAHGDEKNNIIEGLEHLGKGRDIGSLGVSVANCLAKRTKEASGRSPDWPWNIVQDMGKYSPDLDMLEAMTVLLDLADDSLRR